jgi:hypothetical protein
MMGREDIRMVKNAFKDPKNCQNNEYKLNHKTVGVQSLLANLLTISKNTSDIDHSKMPTKASSDVGPIDLMAW